MSETANAVVSDQVNLLRPRGPIFAGLVESLVEMEQAGETDPRPRLSAWAEAGLNPTADIPEQFRVYRQRSGEALRALVQADFSPTRRQAVFVAIAAASMDSPAPPRTSEEFWTWAAALPADGLDDSLLDLRSLAQRRAGDAPLATEFTESFAPNDRAEAAWRASHPAGEPPEGELVHVLRWAQRGETPPSSAGSFAAWAVERWEGDDAVDPLRAMLFPEGSGASAPARAIEARAEVFWNRSGSAAAFALWAATQFRDEGRAIPASAAVRMAAAGIPVSRTHEANDPVTWRRTLAAGEIGKPAVYDDSAPNADFRRARAEMGMKVAAAAAVFERSYSEAVLARRARLSLQVNSREEKLRAEEVMASRRASLLDEGIETPATRYASSRPNDDGLAREREERADAENAAATEGAWGSLRRIVAQGTVPPATPTALRSLILSTPDAPPELRRLVDPDDGIARLAASGRWVVSRSALEAEIGGAIPPAPVIRVVRVTTDPKASDSGIVEGESRIGVSPDIGRENLLDGPRSILEAGRMDAWGTNGFMQDNLARRAARAEALFVYDDRDPARAPVLAEVARIERNIAQMAEAYIDLHRTGPYAPIHAAVGGMDPADGLPKMVFFRSAPRVVPSLPGVELTGADLHRFSVRSAAEWTALVELAAAAPPGEAMPRDHRTLLNWLGDRDAIPSSLQHLADRTLDWRDRGRVSQSPIEPRLLIGPPEEDGLKLRKGSGPLTEADYRDGFWGDRAAKQKYAADYLQALRARIIDGDEATLAELLKRSGRRQDSDRLQQQDDITVQVALIRHAALAATARHRDEIASGDLLGPNALGERLRIIRSIERDLLAHPTASTFSPALKASIEAGQADTERRISAERLGAARPNGPTPILVAVPDPLDDFGGARLAEAVRAAYPNAPRVEVWIPERPARDEELPGRRPWRTAAAKRPFNVSVDAADAQGLLNGILLRSYRSEGMEPARGLSDANGPFVRMVGAQVEAIARSGSDIDDLAGLSRLLSRWEDTRDLPATPPRETVALLFAADPRGNPDLRRPVNPDERTDLRGIGQRVALAAALDAIVNARGLGDEGKESLRAGQRSAIDQLAANGVEWAAAARRELDAGRPLALALLEGAEPERRAAVESLWRSVESDEGKVLASRLLDTEARRYAAALTIDYASRAASVAPGLGNALRTGNAEALEMIAGSQFAKPDSVRAARAALSRVSETGNWEEAAAAAGEALHVPVAGRLQALRARLQDTGDTGPLADELQMIIASSTFGQRPRPLGDRRIPMAASEADAVARERTDIGRLREAVRSLDGETEADAIASGLSELRAAHARLGVEDSTSNEAGKTRAIQLVDDALATARRISEEDQADQPRPIVILDISEGHAERNLEQRRRLGQETWNVDDAESRLRRGAEALSLPVMTGRPLARTGVDLDRDGRFFDQDEDRRDIERTFENHVAPQSESEAQRIAEASDAIRRRPLTHPDGLVFREYWTQGPKLREALTTALSATPRSEPERVSDFRRRLSDAFLRAGDDPTATQLRGVVREMALAGQEGRLRDAPDLAAVGAAASDWIIQEERSPLSQVTMAWRPGGPPALTDDEARRAALYAAGILKRGTPPIQRTDERPSVERRSAVLRGATEGDLLVLRAAALTSARPNTRDAQADLRTPAVASLELGVAILAAARRASDDGRDPVANELRQELATAIVGPGEGNPFHPALRPVVERVAAAEPELLRSNPDLGAVAERARGWREADNAALAIAYTDVRRYAELLEREGALSVRMNAARSRHGLAGAAAEFDTASHLQFATPSGRRLAALWRLDAGGAMRDRTDSAVLSFTQGQGGSDEEAALRQQVASERAPSRRLEILARSEAPLSEGGEAARNSARDLLNYWEQRRAALVDYLATPIEPMTPPLRASLRADAFGAAFGRSKILEVTPDGREYVPSSKSDEEGVTDLPLRISAATRMLASTGPSTRAPDVLTAATPGEVLALRLRAFPEKLEGQSSGAVASLSLGRAIIAAARNADATEQDESARKLRAALVNAIKGEAAGNPFAPCLRPAVEQVVSADPALLTAHTDLAAVAGEASKTGSWVPADAANKAAALTDLMRHARLLEEELKLRSQMKAAALRLGNNGAAAAFETRPQVQLATEEGKHLAATWSQDADGVLRSKAEKSLSAFLGGKDGEAADRVLRVSLQNETSPSARFRQLASVASDLGQSGTAAREDARSLVAHWGNRAKALKAYLDAEIEQVTPFLREALKGAAPIRVPADKALETKSVDEWIGGTVRLQPKAAATSGSSTLTTSEPEAPGNDTAQPVLERIETQGAIQSGNPEGAETGEGGDPSHRSRTEASYTPDLDAAVQARIFAAKGLSKAQEAKLRFLEAATEAFQGSFAKVGRPWYVVSASPSEQDPSKAMAVLARGSDNPKTPIERRTDSIDIPAGLGHLPPTEAASEAAQAHAVALTRAERGPVLDRMNNWAPLAVRIDPRTPTGEKVVVFTDGVSQAEMAFSPNGRPVSGPRLLADGEFVSALAAHRLAAAGSSRPRREIGNFTAIDLTTGPDAVSKTVAFDRDPIHRERAVEAQTSFIAAAEASFRGDPDRHSGDWRAVLLHVDPAHRYGARAVTFEDPATGGRLTRAYGADLKPLPAAAGIDPLDVAAAANRANLLRDAGSSTVLADGVLRPIHAAESAKAPEQVWAMLGLEPTLQASTPLRRLELALPTEPKGDPSTNVRLAEKFGQPGFAAAQAEYVQAATRQFRAARGEDWAPTALYLDPEQPQKARIIVFGNTATGGATSDVFDAAARLMPRVADEHPLAAARAANGTPSTAPFAKIELKESIEQVVVPTAVLPADPGAPRLITPDAHMTAPASQKAEVAADPIRALRAVLRDGEDAFKAALEAGQLDLRVISRSEGIAGFHLLAAEGTPEMMRAALASGQDPRVIDAAGRMPTHHAATHPRPDNLRLLIAAGLSPDDGDDRKRTPGMVAAQNRRPQHLSTVLDAGARLGKKDATGKTIYDHILDAKKGLPPERPDAAGVVPASDRAARAAWFKTKEVFERRAMDRIVVAISKGEEAVAKAFATGFDPRISDPETGRTAAHEIAALGTPTMLQAGVASRLRLDVPDREGRTPLFHAQTAEMVQALVQAKAPLDRPADDGRTPLGHAVAEGRLEVAEALIKAGADPKRVDKSLADVDRSQATEKVLEMAWQNAGGISSLASTINAEIGKLERQENPPAASSSAPPSRWQRPERVTEKVKEETGPTR